MMLPPDDREDAEDFDTQVHATLLRLFDALKGAPTKAALIAQIKALLLTAHLAEVPVARLAKMLVRHPPPPPELLHAVDGGEDKPDITSYNGKPN